MRIERFFHIRTGATRGGATVKVTGITENIALVSVQSVFCSRKDPYCKKTGRELAATAPVKVVPLRYLPKELGRIETEMDKRTKTPAGMTADYTFAIKYFLPKE